MRRLLAFVLILLAGLSSFGQDLHEGFKNPPQSSRPLVWWHWMNGNITPEGLRKDIEWMNRNGIAGFHIFDANFSTPQIVPTRLEYMSEPWKDAFRSALAFADSLGMEITIASSPGFSATGGPWVEPRDAMKKLVWRTVDVEGGAKVETALPEPFTASGPFADLVSTRKWNYYEDVAVVAVRLPEAFADLTSSRVTDTMYSFPEPVTVKAVSYVVESPRNMRHNMPLVCRDSLQVSDDGKTFRTVAGLPIGSTRYETVDIAPVTAKCFRVKFGSATNRVSGLILHSVTMVDHAEEKAGFGGAFDLYDYPTPEPPVSEVVREVVDLSSFVRDGKLVWNAPEGHWRIFRFGASLTGKTNHPASPEATGLEVDKLSPEPWKRYFHNFLNLYKDASGEYFGSKGIRYILNDSYEAESETWTDILPAEFLSRRGYNLMEWLPALTGMVISSAEETERFLWDWRMTLGDLFQENFSVMTDLLRNEYGLEGSYIESHANGRVYPFDGMSIKKTAAVPMSETWVPHANSSTDRISEGITDIRESASVAHIYGQNIVAAESLTCDGLPGRAYSYHPENLKRTADYELYSGVTRFVIHDSAHQPLDDKFPGLGLGRYGQWFHRHETWAEQAGAWTDYLARSCYMLSQGRFVADVLWFYGEDNNATAFYSRRLPDVPDGYNYDYANPEVLYDMVRVKGSNLVTDSGMEYKVLVIDPAIKRMSMKMLTRIAELASQGAMICGSIPEQCASLLDDPAAYSTLRRKVLAYCHPERSEGSMRSEGSNSSVANLPQNDRMKGRSEGSLTPDVIHDPSHPILHVHRTLPDKEIYWVKNLSYDSFTTEVSFRTAGRIPRVWHPEDASIEDVSYRIEDGRTTVTLDFESDDALFVVFDAPAVKQSVTVPRKSFTTVAAVESPWTVEFQEGRGAPESVTLSNLASLTESEDPGVRYFSGTAKYSATVKLPKVKGKIVIDLGDVKNIAQVRMNGKDCGTVWKTPFVVDVTSAAKKGNNTLEVKVTNLWVNRIIGDLQPGAKPITYTPMEFYKAEDPLLPSCLLGPVVFKTEK